MDKTTPFLELENATSLVIKLHIGCRAINEVLQIYDSYHISSASKLCKNVKEFTRKLVVKVFSHLPLCTIVVTVTDLGY